MIYELIETDYEGKHSKKLEMDTEEQLDHDGLRLLSVQTLASRQRGLQDKLELLKSISTTLQKEYDTIRLNILPEKMDEDDITTITLAGVGRVTIQSDLYFSIPADRREEAYHWLTDNGHGDLIQETVNSSSGKAWAKEMLKKGQTLPEDLFKVSPFSRAQITKVK
jgi:hypothetical protein